MCSYVDIRTKGRYSSALSEVFTQSWVQCDYELMKHLVVLPFEVFTPASITTGIEVWTWVISEKPEYEIGVMMEINSAWLATVRFGRGMFSTSQKYSDLGFPSSLDSKSADEIVLVDSYNGPFFHPIQYSPTDKEEIAREMAGAKRLLAPHVLILQMLISRFQAARYRRPGLMLIIQRLVLISARAHRYMRFVASFVLQVTRVFMPSSLVARIRSLAKPVFHSCCSDSRPCVAQVWMRTARMRCGTPCTLPHLLGSPSDRCGFPRILTRCFVDPSVYRWSYGANKIQIHTDVKLLSEFLSCLGDDVGRDNPTLSSLSPSPPPRTSSLMLRLLELIGHVEHGAQSMVQVLRLLVENEILRLNVWNNPTDDPKRGVDSTGTIERTMVDVSSSIVVSSGVIADASSTRRCGRRSRDRLGS